MVKVRALGALAALVAFPLLVLALVAAGVAVVVAVAAGGHSIVLVLKFVLLPLAVAVWVGIKGFRSLRTDEGPSGPEISRAEHPRFWQEVDALARLAETDPPERVVLVPEVNAAVLEVRGRREMVVGLPLLATMTVGELRSVLAHELGHYAGGDTALSARTARARVFLLAASEGAGGIVGPVLRGYARFYAWVSNAASRDMERAADRLSLRVAGSETAARAMEKVVASGLAWQALTADYVPLFTPAGARAPLAEGLRLLTEANDERIRSAAERQIASELSTWQDTHPPTRERVAAFRATDVEGVAPVEGATAAGRPATDLLAAGWLDRAEARLLVHDLPLVAWSTLVARGAAAETTSSAEQISTALQQHGVAAAATTRGLLDAVLADPAVVRPLVDGSDPGALRGAALAVAHRVAMASLTASGRVRIAESWDGPWRPVDAASGAPVDLDARLEQALAGPAEREELCAWLTSRGADLDARPGAAVASPDPSR